MHGEHRWEYTRLILIPTGRFPEAAEQMRAAIALEPLAAAHYNALANRFLKARQFDEALPYLETSRKISPSGVSAIVLQGVAAEGKGNYAEALQRFGEAAHIRRTIWVLGYLGFTLGKLGKKQEAGGVIAELEKKAKDGPNADFEIAVVRAGMGEKERAMEGLERALAAYSHSLLWVKVDGRLDEVRSHPRFPALIKAIGL